MTEAGKINEGLNFELNQKIDWKLQVEGSVINSGCACRSVNLNAYGNGNKDYLNVYNQRPGILNVPSGRARCHCSHVHRLH